MSTSPEVLDLLYPDKPDANGYAKKYYKRRAFYFGAHNSPESYVLFGEWKRRLLETGVATDVKSLRRELAHSSVPTPHFQTSGPAERKSTQLVILGLVAIAILFGAILASAKILSSTMGPTVDGLTMTNEEIEFIRGVRLHRNDLSAKASTRGEMVAELAMRLMEEGPNEKNQLLSELGF